MYRQYDGYLECHGQELAVFLSDTPLVNGISMNEKGNCFNGSGCLAAQMVAFFKDGAGGIYLEGIDNEGQGHDYQIICDEDKHEILIKVTIYDEVVFDGTRDEYNAFLTKEMAKEEE